MIEKLISSVPNESSRVEFESILKYYLYSGLYPINCLNYIIYIMRVYASLMRVKIRTLRPITSTAPGWSIPLLEVLHRQFLGCHFFWFWARIFRLGLVSS